jgi:hypothetical protein
MGDRRGAYRVLWGNLRERDCLEDISVDRRIILKFVFKKEWKDMDWIYVLQDRVKWEAVVNIVMKLWFP